MCAGDDRNCPEFELHHQRLLEDLDGDGWKDLVFGKHTSTQVWMNVPPPGLAFATK